MIAHVVLFTPREDLSAEERARFGTALERALSSIESVRRYRVGRRVKTGAAYDNLPGAYGYCGVIEFDDSVGLETYLAHPAHVELGQLFYTSCLEAFAGDFDVVDRAPAAALARWSAD
jgi:stress responsive alpha/beta barrel protein